MPRYAPWMLCLALLSFPLSASADNAKATALAAKLMEYASKGQFGKLHKAMSAKIQKLVTVKKLAKATRQALKITGPFVKGSLKLKSHKTSGPYKVYVFHASFKNDKGTLTMVLNAKGKAAQFTIKTPKLIKAVVSKIKKKVKKVKLDAATQKALVGLTVARLKAYNKGDGAGFCGVCTARLKKFFKGRFKAFHKSTMAKYGAYKSGSFVEAEKTRKKTKKGIIYTILWYKAKFAKKSLYVRAVYQPDGKSYKLAGILITPKKF